MKTLVLGASGMAGHVATLYLREHGLDVDTLAAKKPLDDKTHMVDVMDQVAFHDFLNTHQYDVVINCIGVLVKQSDEHKDLASYINSYLPHFLEHYYKDSSTRVIQLGSDGVFSGKHSPYREDSDFDGQGFYDRSKALGEINNDKDLTLRLSIVGPDLSKSGVGLFNWFCQQSGHISGYDRVFWSGITTLELAKALHAAIEQNIHGIYHLAPETSISKFELLQLFKDSFDRADIDITPNSDAQFDRTLLNTRTDFDFQVSDYRTMIKDMRTWIEAHPQLYPHYARKDKKRA